MKGPPPTRLSIEPMADNNSSISFGTPGTLKRGNPRLNGLSSVEVFGEISPLGLSYSWIGCVLLPLGHT
ncbi:hypothetical protein PENTCL1PPCAC_8768 [Pristionchus entomophagus]|uniref:Uncharacterized protein n=1 Tax=Pristionchus entomophagus TaxID=358040 RepID=A0AAV5T1A4_9BILA|nr:hypothetical protein PENTCL1PPCAC_8768 [Pristionchus entomophagus]